MLRNPSLYFTRQVKEIQSGGISVFCDKSYRLLVRVLVTLPIFLLTLPVVLPLVLLIRLLRPLILVRFGLLRSERIGHFAGNTEMYLCERDAAMQSSRTLDLFYCNPMVCNQQLKKMWGRKLNIFWVTSLLAAVNKKIPGAEKHIVKLPSDRDTTNYLTRFKPHLTFTTTEKLLGDKYLKNKGLSSKTKFVCLYGRDSAYLDIVHPNGTLGWSHHDYRNSCIHGHIPAVEALTQKGYFAFRMGTKVKDALRIDNPMIIDYAVNGDRTDFLDIYLCSKCYFFLCSEGGLAVVPYVLRRPIAAVNQIPIQYCPTRSSDIFIPKKLWLKEKGRFMTFTEIFKSGAGKFLKSQQYERAGIEVIENTPEEITALAMEMDERLMGTWQATEEDEELQQRFLALFPKSDLHGKSISRIGAAFLQKNRELLL